VILTYLPHEIQTLYTSYTPSLIEYLAGGGVVAFGMLAITIGLRYFKIVDHDKVEHEPVLKKTYALGSAD
jgi:Ni/Fe-hydrogenase subunit HybB-like protein